MQRGRASIALLSILVLYPSSENRFNIFTTLDNQFLDVF